MPTKKRYTVKHVFRTLQGEGFHAGRPAVFIRFVGCNMWTGYEDDRAHDALRTGATCPLFCDTDFTKEGASKYTAPGLVDATLQAGADETGFVVLTGGEPLLQADAALMKAFRAAGIYVAVETNGTQDPANAFRDEDGNYHGPHWITVSPKLPEKHLSVAFLDELKLVVPAYLPADYAELAACVKPVAFGIWNTQPRWLQPEDGPHIERNMKLAVQMAHDNPGWRVSVQTHKILGLD